MVVRLKRVWDDTCIAYSAPKTLVQEFGKRRLAKIINYLAGEVKGKVIKKREFKGSSEFVIVKNIGNVKYIDVFTDIPPYAIISYLYFKSLDDARKACIKVLKQQKETTS